MDYLYTMLYLKSLQIGQRSYPISFGRKDLNAVKKRIEHNQDFISYLKKSRYYKRRCELKHKKICFVLLPYEYGDWHQYTINQALLLYVKGYDIEFLIDDLSGMEEEYIFPGITGVALTLLLPILKLIAPFSSIHYLSSYSGLKLTQKDMTEADNLYRATEYWLSGMYKKLSDKQYKIFVHSASIIKGAMAECDADVLQLYTGSHTKKGFYTRFAKKRGIRVATFDSQGKTGRTISYSSQGEQCHCPDIPYTILHDLLNEEAKKEIYKEVREKYRAIAPGKFNEHYDILIPLNIDWDAAALNVQGFFKSTDEWIQEVLEYVLCNTNATIALREHPARKWDPEYNYGNLKERIKVFRGYEPNRVLYIDYDMPISTYDVIKHCSLVLPYSSTVGMEALAMNKKVLNCMNVYFAQAGIGEITDSKEKLFARIKECVENPEEPSEAEKCLAALGIALHANITVKAKFSEINTNWNTASFTRMLNDKDINKMLISIAEGIPFCLLNIQDKLEHNGKII